LRSGDARAWPAPNRLANGRASALAVQGASLRDEEPNRQAGGVQRPEAPSRRATHGADLRRRLLARLGARETPASRLEMQTAGTAASALRPNPAIAQARPERTPAAAPP